MRVVIIGAGPCGLAAASEARRLEHEDWILLEKSAEPGGLAASITDGQGFTWDHGGHVVFSHFGEFDHLVRRVMGDELYRHERVSYVMVAGARVPYPFQNNLHHLPPTLAYECLEGLILAGGGSIDLDFAQWQLATFGAGITRHFLQPYNTKVWRVPLEAMSATWVADRISVPDWRRALRNVVEHRDDVGWGPNSTFAFPARGGTGEIYRRLAVELGNRVLLGTGVISVDPVGRTVTCSNGSTYEFDALISTMPIDKLVAMCGSVPDDVKAAAAKLVHNSVWMIGIAFEQPLDDSWCWTYVPDPAVPFYRVTNFAKYSPANVPDGRVDRYSSFMTEVSFAATEWPGPPDLVKRVEQALRRLGLVRSSARVASTCALPIPYAYPVPTLGRDDALRVIQPWLAARGIWSRGRFGTWRYEHGNMDHAAKMGVDVLRRVIGGEMERIPPI